MPDIEIREHAPGQDVGDFIRVAHDVFRGDPAWVAPLDMDMRDRLTPKKNPFFQHGEVALFTAWRNGRPVGRCSAQVDWEHLRIHEDDAGFFGFFDTLEDPEAAKALLTAAEAWVARRGMKRLRGPLSLNINEEVGMLIEGFEHPPFIMMPHSRPYQASLVEGAGFAKLKDVLAWRYEAGEIPARARRAWDELQNMPEVKIRSVRRSRMEEDLRILMDIFNDAWSDNWGFVPATEAETRKSAADLKLIVDENLAFIAEIDGRPMGMCVCVPNINEAIADLGGKLFPTGLAKLLWRVKVKRPGSARLWLLGVRKELRGVKRYGGLSTAMYVELQNRGVARGYHWGELGWTLEDNHLINLGIRAMGGKVYKRFRVFEKELPSAAQNGGTR